MYVLRLCCRFLCCLSQRRQPHHVQPQELQPCPLLRLVLLQLVPAVPGHHCGTIHPADCLAECSHPSTDVQVRQSLCAATSSPQAAAAKHSLCNNSDPYLCTNMQCKLGIVQAGLCASTQRCAAWMGTAKLAKALASTLYCVSMWIGFNTRSPALPCCCVSSAGLSCARL